MILGERVKLTAEGKRLLVHNRRGKLRYNHVGTYIGIHRSGAGKVLWDGYATAMYLHPDFFESSHDILER